MALRDVASGTYDATVTRIDPDRRRSGYSVYTVRVEIPRSRVIVGPELRGLDDTEYTSRAGTFTAITGLLQMGWSTRVQVDEKGNVDYAG